MKPCMVSTLGVIYPCVFKFMFSGFTVRQFVTSLIVPHGKLLYNQDFGVWNISYQSVACTNWEGWNHAAALGSVTSLGSSACCPDNPTVGLPSLFLHYQLTLFIREIPMIPARRIPTTMASRMCPLLYF